jgi:leader peptidase (prepilin peptidase)/N-methyltransferase
VTSALVAVLGFVLGLAAHDLGVQGLADDPLRPLTGTCPSCRRNRGWLRWKCPHCSRRVAREPVIGLISAAFAFALFHGFGFTLLLGAYLGFLVLTVALTVTDLEEMRIVDRLNFPGTAILTIVLAVVALTGGDADRLWRGLLGALAYFAGSTLMWLLAGGKGFGAGDVKLSPLLGLYTAFLSWGTLGWSVFITAVVGGVLGAAVLIFGRGGAKSELPYGPPMVIGAWTAIALAVIGAIPLPA